MIFLMDDWHFIELSGPDAPDFLHRMTSIDIKKGKYGDGFLLEATGKIILYFKMAYSNGSFILASPHPADRTVAAFEKSHFSEKLKIAPLKGWRYFKFIDCEESAAVQEKLHLSYDHRILVLPEDLGESFNETGDVSLFVPPDAELPDLLKSMRLGSKEEREILRISRGDPRSPIELSGGWNPLELGLTGAVHEDKGCYPGQEVIEKIRSTGRTPRSLVKIKGQGQCPATPLALDEGGTITSAIGTDQETHQETHQGTQWIGLAITRKSQGLNLNLQGQKLEVRP